VAHDDDSLPSSNKGGRMVFISGFWYAAPVEKTLLVSVEVNALASDPLSLIASHRLASIPATELSVTSVVEGAVDDTKEDVTSSRGSVGGGGSSAAVAVVSAKGESLAIQPKRLPVLSRGPHTFPVGAALAFRTLDFFSRACLTLLFISSSSNAMRFLV